MPDIPTIDQTLYVARTFDSQEHGWQSLVLRRHIQHPVVEEATIPAVAEQMICVLLRGEKTAEVGTDGSWQSARITSGAVSMTAPHRPTRIRWWASLSEPLDNLAVYLPAGLTARVAEELWDRDPAQVRFPDALKTPDPVLRETLVGLLRAAEAGVPDLYAESAAEFITVHALTRHGSLPALRTYRGDDHRIRRARAFLREHLHRPVTAVELAAEAGMSRYHFLRVFRSQTGESPHRYGTRLRIERARYDLEYGTANISEIASRYGFANPSHFATTFRRETGYAPSEYRRRYRL